MPAGPDGWVVDASVALAWVFEDEARPETDALLDDAMFERVLAPSLWRLEVANALLTAQRRGRMSYETALDRFNWLMSLPLRIAAAPDRRDALNAFGWAQGHGLTAYDAAYLDLAFWSRAPLATLDRRLAGAARKAGVAIHPALTDLV